MTEEKNFKSISDDIKKDIEIYMNTEVEKFLHDKYNRFLHFHKSTEPIRKKFMELLSYSEDTGDTAEILHDFFEDMMIKIYKSPGRILMSILMHELSIYAIADYLVKKQYEEIGYLLNAPYKDPNPLFSGVLPFTEFMHSGGVIFDDILDYKNNPDAVFYEDFNKVFVKIIENIGKVWIENIPPDLFHKDILITEDDMFMASDKDIFTAADTICYNHAWFKKGGKNEEDDRTWYPFSYYATESSYVNPYFKYFAKSLEKEIPAERMVRIFGFDSSDSSRDIEDFRQHFKDTVIKGMRVLQPYDTLKRPHLLHFYINAEDIGKKDGE